MTLCVTYITKSGRAVALTDSLITTTQRVTDDGGFLPSNEKIVHQTPYAVKLHNIQSAAAYGSNEVDILATIAGNVLLGLQCTLHIDAFLQYGLNRWFDDIKFDIREKILDFWFDARDKQLQMAFALFDHKINPHLLECRADSNGKFGFYEVEPFDDFSLSVLGDDSEVAKKKILSKVCSMQYEYDLEASIHTACVSTLQDYIDDENQIFIGGYVQGAQLSGYKGDYLVVDYHGNKYFRGTMLESYEELALPVLDMNDLLYRILPHA